MTRLALLARQNWCVSSCLKPNLVPSLSSHCHSHFRLAMARFRAYTSDSDEDEADVSMEVPPPQPVQPQKATNRQGTRISAAERDQHETESEGASGEDEGTEEEESEESEDGDEDEDDDDGSEGGRGGGRGHPVVDSTIIPWAREIGVDPQKMHVMQTSLFRMPEEERALKALNEPLSRRKLLLPSSRARKHSRDSEGEGHRADSRQVSSSFICIYLAMLMWRNHLACLLCSRH